MAFGRYADANGTNAPYAPTPAFASATIVVTCTMIRPRPSAAAVRCVYCVTTRVAADRIFTDASAPSDVDTVSTINAASPAPRAVYQSDITPPPSPIVQL